MSKLALEYSIQVNRSMKTLEFEYNGRLISSNDTPLSLQMKDDDVIYVRSTTDVDEGRLRFRERVPDN